MSLWLFVLGYAALPLVVAVVYWSSGRRVQGAMWAIACLVGPLLVFWAALRAIGAASPPGEGLGGAVVAGFIAGIVWLALCVAALILTARSGKAKTVRAETPPPQA